MKLKEFLSDTLSVGKGSVRIPISNMVTIHRSKYNELAKKASKPFHHEIYTITPGNRKIIHVKVPSETVNDFYYDVLLELTPEDSSSSLADCHVKIFSNCPSFVYTSAYIFAHWDPDASRASKSPVKGMMIDLFKRKLPRDRLLLPGAEQKLGEQPIHDKPTTRNPMGFPMFDKSLYYATFYVLENVTLEKLQTTHNNITELQLYANIMDFDTLMTKRKIQAEKDKRTKEENQKKLADAIKGTERKVTRANKVSGVKRALSMKTVGGVSKPKKPRSFGK